MQRVEDSSSFLFIHIHMYHVCKRHRRVITAKLSRKAVLCLVSQFHAINMFVHVMRGKFNLTFSC